MKEFLEVDEHNLQSEKLSVHNNSKFLLIKDKMQRIVLELGKKFVPIKIVKTVRIRQNRSGSPSGNSMAQVMKIRSPSAKLSVDSR